MIKTEIQQVCPYTGLRSFTEEESLYFKGRDFQIGQITSLLEQNKFLMVTGASGEGKSSVVYAGLIPNARAGFFKAKYTNWVVADFRPERNPLHNMAASLAQQFSMQPGTVATELKRGFSALTDLYVNSAFFIDESDAEWPTMDPAMQRDKKRKAANLMILVDQFEEFFTNPENFYNEAPSQDSQIVVNLLLETARIALKRGLPIYVVCTMRSDYIGQCSAFRGLAEYIGFSQFFVPRLKRKDLKQVIEEPAILSGNQISQRLIERLLFDLSEGIDQLPILQHALSQIWLAASRGSEEMDLIHYAMVGGMDPRELPDGEVEKFNAWLASQPASKRALFKQTGLKRVIEIHANILYETAYEQCKQALPGDVSPRDVKRIIALTFACLTKIDNSRAVRNRMTLQEITDIIDTEHLHAGVVGTVIDIFREEGNSFIRPFKTDDPESRGLEPATVLDITHESLIRSWQKLNEWVDKEFEFYTNFLDLQKQLDRWVENGRSGNYLLPIGPLSFFENWYDKCQPNVAWVKRYSEKLEDEQLERARAEATLRNIQDFLKNSGRKVWMARTFMKYGSHRIAAVVALIFTLIISGFYWYDATQKQNQAVLARIEKDGERLLASEFVDNFDKGTYVILREANESGALKAYFDEQSDIRQRVRQEIAAYSTMSFGVRNFNEPLKLDVVRRIAEDLDRLPADVDQEYRLRQRVAFLLNLAYDDYYNPGLDLGDEMKRQAQALRTTVLAHYQDTRLYKVSLPDFLNQAVALWLFYGAPTSTELTEMINAISPLESADPNQAFATYYPQGSFMSNGVRPLDFAGGYHVLSMLYAAAGDDTKVIACFDQMRQTRDYFNDQVFNNFNNVIGFLYQYGHRGKVSNVVDWVSRQAGRSTLAIYNELFNRSIYLSQLFRVNFDFGGFTQEGHFELNLCLGGPDLRNAIAEDYEKEVARLGNVAERNYLMAMHHKRLALVDFKYRFDRRQEQDRNAQEEHFARAIEWYNQVGPSFLDQASPVSWSQLAGTRTTQWTRREAFLYPDYIGSWLTEIYHSDIFYKYLRDHQLLTKLYTQESDYQQLHFWLANAFEQRPFPLWQQTLNPWPIEDALLEDILTVTQGHNGFDRNLPWIVLTNRNFERGDTLEALKYFRLLEMDSRPRWVSLHEPIHQNFVLNELRFMSGHLASLGNREESMKVIGGFADESERVFAYTLAAREAYNNGAYDLGFEFLDSAYTKSSRFNATQIPPFRDFRMNLIEVMASIGGEELSALAVGLLRDLQEGRKFGGLMAIVNGYCYNGNLYRAKRVMPPTLTDQEEMILNQFILWHAIEAKGTKSPLFESQRSFYRSDVLWFSDGLI